MRLLPFRMAGIDMIGRGSFNLSEIAVHLTLCREMYLQITMLINDVKKQKLISGASMIHAPGRLSHLPRSKTI